MLRAALSSQLLRPRFAYIAPTFKQAKTVAWDYLKHYADVVPLRQFNESELRADFPNGGQVRIYGADNPDALRGIYLDGVVLDEFGMMQGRVWSEVIRPALTDRKGWAIFIGTPNGRNAFWEKRDEASNSPEWFLAEHKASETGLIEPSELESSRATMTPDEFAQEYECSFEASVKGAIFAAELEAARSSDRITRVPVDPILPVQTVWDLGVGDATAIWFVQAHKDIRLIDYYEASGEGLPHYAEVLKRKGYHYGKHWAPHDIQVRELSSGRSRLEAAKSLGIKFDVVPNVALEDGIHAARMILPRCWFDADRCKAGLEALQNYRWDYNTRLGEFKPTPVHDWASHGADAFRYAALAINEQRKPVDTPKPMRYGTGGWMR